MDELLIAFRAESSSNAGDSALGVAPGPNAGADDEHALMIREEQFTRNTQFFGAADQAKVEGAFVAVIGCGGVGSHAAVTLARSGVSRLRLVDFDRVTVSSLNRHAAATWEDVGVQKTHCLAAFIKKFNPF